MALLRFSNPIVVASAMALNSGVADKLTPERRSWNMSRIRGGNTQPERLVRSLLHSMGYRFRLHAKKLPGKPDVILPKYRIAILVHGCFWHRHAGCRNCTTPTNNQAFWLKKLEGNAARDRRNLRALRLLGWRPVVIWECELEKMDKLEGRLARLLSEDVR